MKSITTGLLVLLIASCFSQNIKDAYANHESSSIVWQDNLSSYDGEYQIFLDKFFWEASNSYGNPLKNGIVTFSIEAVSFPFIPDDLNPNDINNFNNSTVRNFTTDFITDGYDYKNLFSNNSPSQVSYDGFGWQFGKYRIFQKVRNRISNPCEGGVGADFECKGHYTLISYVFADFIDTSYYSTCLLPHTVLKHTLYFHCIDPDTTIIDSLSWVYDNTRGDMKRYPFYHPDSTKEESKIDLSTYDVTFRPTFPFGTYYYDPDSTNADWYDSGVANNTGSVDYFPPNEIFPYYPYNCSFFDLYFNPNDTSGEYMFNDSSTMSFYSGLVHPPSYILLDAPLLNFNGKEYAGYKQEAKMDGISHSYIINDSFDLRIINPSEKIIYNPSYVDIYCDLTFPCNYKFLTLHGKYPDKQYEVHHGGLYSSEYWDGITGFNFDYDRDYPIPVNCSTNSECLSVYEIHKQTITFDPWVIVMDAHFKGSSTSNKSRIVYDPYYTFGNWTYDSASIELDTVSYGELAFERCTQIHESGEFKSEVIEPPPVLKDLIKILSNSTSNPQIEINLDDIHNVKLYIYNVMGNIIREEHIFERKLVIDCEFLKQGIYYIILSKNGKILDNESLCKI